MIVALAHVRHDHHVRRPERLRDQRKSRVIEKDGRLSDLVLCEVDLGEVGTAIQVVGKIRNAAGQKDGQQDHVAGKSGSLPTAAAPSPEHRRHSPRRHQRDHAEGGRDTDPVEQLDTDENEEERLERKPEAAPVEKAGSEEQLVEDRDREVDGPRNRTTTGLLQRRGIRGVRILDSREQPVHHPRQVERCELHPVRVGDRKRADVHRENAGHERIGVEEGRLASRRDGPARGAPEDIAEHHQRLAQQHEETQPDHVRCLPSDRRGDEDEQRQQVERDHGEDRLVFLRQRHTWYPVPYLRRNQFDDARKTSANPPRCQAPRSLTRRCCAVS